MLNRWLDTLYRFEIRQMERSKVSRNDLQDQQQFSGDQQFEDFHLQRRNWDLNLNQKEGIWGKLGNFKIDDNDRLHKENFQSLFFETLTHFVVSSLFSEQEIKVDQNDWDE
jgi:hypothetical protein